MDGDVGATSFLLSCIGFLISSVEKGLWVEKGHKSPVWSTWGQKGISLICCGTRIATDLV